MLPFDIFREAYVDTLIFLAERALPDVKHNFKAFTYPKRAKVTELLPAPWENISQEQISKRRDGKILMSCSAMQLATLIDGACKRTFGDVIEMKRGVLFDKAMLTDSKSGSNSHRYFEGDVYRYELNYRAPSWVEFGAKMTEYPNDFRWFEGERLLLRRLVNRQQRLMATLADKTFITNKNLYSILPKAGALPLKVILAILNSSLISRLYIESVSQATKDDFPQVTITDALSLPFPTEISANAQALLSGLVDGILAAKRTGDGAKVMALESEIDTRVFRLYAITPDEIKIVKDAAKS